MIDAIIRKYLREDHQFYIVLDVELGAGAFGKAVIVAVCLLVASHCQLYNSLLSSGGMVGLMVNARTHLQGEIETAHCTTFRTSYGLIYLKTLPI